jgi:hypothetical protein
LSALSLAVTEISGCRWLSVVGHPTADSPAWPGVEFVLVVEKKDAYGQTIVSDSSSLLQVTGAN